MGTDCGRRSPWATWSVANSAKEIAPGCGNILKAAPDCLFHPE